MDVYNRCDSSTNSEKDLKVKCGNFSPEIYPFKRIQVKVIKIEPAFRDVEVLVKNQ